MKLFGRRAARVLTSAAPLLLLAALAPSPQEQPAPAPVPASLTAPSAGEDATAARGETRLRKLHLVRPDLIPYPIAFEVYC